MNLKTFFSSQYMFTFNSAYVNPQEKLFFLGGVILILLSVALKVAAILAPSPVDKKYRQQFYKLFLSIGISLSIWYLCRYENAIFFGTPFVAWAIVFVGIVWLVFIVASVFKHYGATKLQWKKEQEKLKYLPK